MLQGYPVKKEKKHWTLARSTEINSNVSLPNVLKNIAQGNQEEVLKADSRGSKMPLGRFSSFRTGFLS